MFNEELKDRYVLEKEKQLTISSRYIYLQFEYAEENEVDLGKDLSNWTVKEIIDYYKFLNKTSVEVLMCINSILSQYTQFCLDNGLVRDNQNHYLELNKTLLTECVNKAAFDKMVVTKDIILKWLLELPNSRDQWILYSLWVFGKSKDFYDIVNAKVKDVDFTENTILLPDGRKIDLDDKMRYIISNCATDNVYYSISGKGVKTMTLIDHMGCILKDYPNVNENASDFSRGRNVYVACMRIFDYFGVPYLTPNAIVESGKLNMIRERAEDIGISPKEYLYSDKISEVEYKYKCKITRSIYVKKYSDYL